jgi:hypothetical protein
MSHALCPDALARHHALQTAAGADES